jgi:hypothetical protein
MNFADWFIDQHGPRPSSKNIVQLVKEAIAIEEKATAARLLVQDCRAWDLRWTSALYAWQLSDKDKVQ